MKRIVWTVVMISVVGVPTLFGQMGPGKKRYGNFGDMTFGNRRLGIGMLTNLSQDQRDRIFAIQQNLRKDTANLYTEAEQIRYDLHKVLTASSLDEKKAKDLYTKLQNVQQKIAQRQFEAKLETLKLLTPEQRQQLQASGLNRKWNKPRCMW